MLSRKNGVENFGKQSTSPNEKVNDIREQNKKQAACKIITELSDG